MNKVRRMSGAASGTAVARRKPEKKFSQAFFSQLLKLRTNCEDLSSI